MLYGMLERLAPMMAFVDDFRLLGAIFHCLIPLMFLMKRARPQKSVVVAH